MWSFKNGLTMLFLSRGLSDVGGSLEPSKSFQDQLQGSYISHEAVVRKSQWVPRPPGALISCATTGLFPCSLLPCHMWQLLFWHRWEKLVGGSAAASLGRRAELIKGKTRNSCMPTLPLLVPWRAGLQLPRWPPCEQAPSSPCGK